MFCAVDGGYVRYSVKGLIKRSGLSRNLRTKMLFTVLDVLDLNFVPNARVRVSQFLWHAAKAFLISLTCVFWLCCRHLIGL